MKTLAIICAVAAFLMGAVSLLSAASGLGDMFRTMQYDAGGAVSAYVFYILIDSVATMFYVLLGVFLFKLSGRFAREDQQ